MLRQQWVERRWVRLDFVARTGHAISPLPSAILTPAQTRCLLMDTWQKCRRKAGVHHAPASDRLCPSSAGPVSMPNAACTASTISLAPVWLVLQRRVQPHPPRRRVDLLFLGHISDGVIPLKQFLP